MKSGSVWQVVSSLFIRKGMTAAELHRSLGPLTTQNVTGKMLDKGAERQWRRMNDKEFQEKEALEALDRLIPVNK